MDGLEGDGVAALKKLTADWYGCWREVWRRDADYHDPLDRWFFDTRTAEVLWVSENCLDLATDVLQQVDEQAEHFEEIPPLTHAQHHEIFREFFDGLDAEVQKLCNPVSIGGFLKDYEFHFGESYDWQEFHGEILQERATAWLKERGWGVEWSDGEED